MKVPSTLSVVISLLATGTSCMAAGSAQNSHYIMLSELELQSVIPGSEIRFKDPTLIKDAPNGYRFERDGTYVDLGPRGRRGIWEIREGKICRDPGGDRNNAMCEPIYRDQIGNYFAKNDVLLIADLDPMYGITIETIN